MIIFYSGPKH